jgi:hypothetical protein
MGIKRKILTFFFQHFRRKTIPSGESGRRVFESSELPLPELIGASEILTDELRKKVISK